MAIVFMTKTSSNWPSVSLMLFGTILTLVLGALDVDAVFARATDTRDGCVSCHIFDRNTGVDYRLSTKLNEWARSGVPDDVMNFARRAVAPGVQLRGVHPDISTQLNGGVIPKLCLDCHQSNPTLAPDLGRLLHMIKYDHQSLKTKNHFFSVYRGLCVHCHILDTDSGNMGVKSGRE